MGSPTSSVRIEHCVTVTDLSDVGQCPAGQALVDAPQGMHCFVPRRAGAGCRCSGVARCPAGHTWLQYQLGLVTGAISGDGRATFTCQDVNTVLHCMALLPVFAVCVYGLGPSISYLHQVGFVDQFLDCSEIPADLHDLTSRGSNIQRPANDYLKAVISPKSRLVGEYPFCDLASD